MDVPVPLSGLSCYCSAAVGMEMVFHSAADAATDAAVEMTAAAFG